jgi:uncharacterized protein (TIGR00369 family)
MASPPASPSSARRARRRGCGRETEEGADTARNVEIGSRHRQRASGLRVERHRTGRGVHGRATELTAHDPFETLGGMRGVPSNLSAPHEAPFLATVGIRTDSLSAGHARLALPYRDGNANRNGSLHGGVVAATIDIAAATVARAGIDPARWARSSTIDFTVHYLAPAVREDVFAEATVLRRGRDITFVDVTVATAVGGGGGGRGAVPGLFY